MKKNIAQGYLLVLIWFISSQVFTIIPQENHVIIRGIVLDVSTHLPMYNAVVQISELDKFTTTDVKGIFEFTNVPHGKFSLEASYIGYRKYSEEINVKGNDVLGLIIHLRQVPLQTSTIVVTGEHPDTRFDDLYEFTSTLKGKELDRDLGTTLASTLKNETGLAMRTMGPAPARPVIRGLGSDRVFISEDGFKTSDLSATSPDHAVTVEPFTIERIEVLRGPRILLQNSTTLGGVVNILRGEIPETRPPSFTGSAGIYGETINKGYLGAVTGELPVYDFVLRGEISRRKTSNLYTPAGELKNSDIYNLSYSSGISFIKDWGYAGLSLKEYETDYGIPGGFVGAHPDGVDINMYKRDINSKLSIDIKNNFIRNIEFKLSRNYYHHTEFERSDLIGAEFSIFNYQAVLNINNRGTGLFDSGTMGVSSEIKDFNIGGFVFTPPAKSYKYSAFIYQTINLDHFSFEIAGRYNYDLMKPEKLNISGRDRLITSRNFNTYSLAFSGMYEITSGIFTGVTISRSSRVPTLEELYSEGPHLAAYSYDIGNPGLKDEKGIGSEIFFYNKSEKHFFNLTLFRNDLSYYIIPRNTGKINFNTLLPVYQTTGIGALMYGIEGQLDYRFSASFDVSASVSYTRGKIDNTSEDLPAIPPLKMLLEIKYNAGNLLAGISLEAALRQQHTDLFEEPTAGYLLPNLFLQYSFFWQNIVSNFSLNVENILNTEYRNHLSRLKSIIPEPGRNLRFTWRVFF